MPLETMGMLSFAFPENEFPVSNSYSNRHYKHPSSVWARASQDNYLWTLHHGIAQCEEYTRRYKREHDSEKYIYWAADNFKYLNFPAKDLTPFARAFGPYKDIIRELNIQDDVFAYRYFYILDKASFAKWPSAQEIPEWWGSQADMYIDKSFNNGIYSKR